MPATVGVPGKAKLKGKPRDATLGSGLSYPPAATYSLGRLKSRHNAEESASNLEQHLKSANEIGRLAPRRELLPVVAPLKTMTTKLNRKSVAGCVANLTSDSSKQQRNVEILLRQGPWSHRPYLAPRNTVLPGNVRLRL